MGQVAVREATSGDAAGIASVRARSWQVAYAHVFPHEALAALSGEEGLERSADHWREMIEGRFPRAHTMVADAGGETVGFASIGRALDDETEPDHVGELYAVYVQPEAWGRGIGRALMSAALDRLRRERFGEAILWVLEDNPRTRRFYELAGWRADGGRKTDEWFGTAVDELRYRVTLAS